MAFSNIKTYSVQMSQCEIRFLDNGECQARLNIMTRVVLDITIDKDVLCGVEIYSGSGKMEKTFYAEFKFLDYVNFFAKRFYSCCHLL